MAKEEIRDKDELDKWWQKLEAEYRVRSQLQRALDEVVDRKKRGGLDENKS